MAIEAHHLALLPACRRHSRRQRAHRDLTRMIEHLESHESEWMETPMASRNKSLLKKWREQIKVYFQVLFSELNVFLLPI